MDWAKWRQSFRGMQDNPLFERIFAAASKARKTGGAKSDWRLKIEAAAPEDREPIIGQAVREVVGSVLRVKPDSLRDEQPLTDLGLDSLMGVEIENSLEATIGVALPPTSLMRARTIGQIATLIAGHMGAKTAAPGAEPAPCPRRFRRAKRSISTRSPTKTSTSCSAPTPRRMKIPIRRARPADSLRPMSDEKRALLKQ